MRRKVYQLQSISNGIIFIDLRFAVKTCLTFMFHFSIEQPKMKIQHAKMGPRLRNMTIYIPSFFFSRSIQITKVRGYTDMTRFIYRFTVDRYKHMAWWLRWVLVCWASWVQFQQGAETVYCLLAIFAVDTDSESSSFKPLRVQILIFFFICFGSPAAPRCSQLTQFHEIWYFTF